MSDLYQFSMTGDGREHLQAALKYARLGICAHPKTVHGWGITDAGILVIFSGNISDKREHIIEKGRVVGGEDALPDFISAWLKEAKYPEQPYIDGSCEKGFKITNVWDDSYVQNEKSCTYSNTPQWVFWDLYTLVVPEWIEYHK